MFVVGWRCSTCKGSLFYDDGDLRCFACGRSPTPPQLPVRRSGRRSLLDTAAIDRIRTVMALARYGLKHEAAGLLAAEYGLSPTYIRDIGLGKQVTSR